MPFADIIGHERVVEVFRRALRSGKTSHSYLFEGPAGCGRKTTARALVQAIFCTEREDDACGVCASCRKVAADSHADIHYIEPDGQFIKIEQVRELQRDLSMRPYEAPRKACIIESAERFNPSAGNSLLKTLEEPPGNAIIILLTENAGMLLPTIRSRCQLIRFSALSTENVRLLLEQHGMAPETAELLAPMSGGSIQRAQELDNDTLSNRKDTLLARLSALDRNRIATIFDASEELGTSRDETLETLDMLISFMQDTAHLAAGSSAIVNAAVRPALEGFAAKWPLQRTLQILEDSMETRRAVQRNANSKLALDRLFMRIAATAC
ncbi:DNA polymerase III subunit delta' [Oryzomonas japonica]|uniref:DNA polymerase III subunit delta' n=1 Tax=Oryzomonas japonica TaxID=2603858 RepID=A0A7J4ZUT3_9BACT|nr:DNA polymerase III subunit delta' [Oryzomonas japonica]KAB0666689.1 DNA polymerase III subunit delta' [Oryzomonas japonica]